MFYRVFALALLLVALWGGLARSSGASGRGRAYLVKPGDTLWSIADRSYGGDTRKAVWELEQRNSLGENTVIAPGQKLVLPW
ncbi:MAG: LysM domain-containing protein [Gaiellaceae bacterium]